MRISGLYRYVMVALAAFVVALAALWIGQQVRSDAHEETRIHAIMHRELDLDAAQEARVDVLERDFADRRTRLEGELRTANARLAAAIAREHAYGPDVEQAVDQSHIAMGELQKATLQHVFAMRGVLRPDQTGRFDKAVAAALMSPTVD
ncbi:periplasmic heavy metal sensor [Novosphingobium guangzhouense]|uniref:Heavy metal resistance protein n=1 Tax=Novosphingobium guangzhouense TaxID=1850347 RepID=A0A2K2FVI7_9SPHN|nr:periplasmic heavy metal sensor [Novosphingobium guangzhouense]PNU02796.1 heavy metal resistance protein [Novosphingobium guangzhouense]